MSDLREIYLDFNATTPLASEVVADITHALRNEWANPSSQSELGKRARRTVEVSRSRVAEMLNCQPSDVIFTSGGTEVCTTNCTILFIKRYLIGWRYAGQQYGAVECDRIFQRVE